MTSPMTSAEIGRYSRIRPLVRSCCVMARASHRPSVPPSAAMNSDSASTRPEDEPAREADGLQRRQFVGALAHGDRHRVAGHQQQREEDDGADGGDEELDVAHLLHHGRRKRRLGLRARLRSGVRELGVDGLGRPRAPGPGWRRGRCTSRRCPSRRTAPAHTGSRDASRTASRRRCPACRGRSRGRRSPSCRRRSSPGP